MTRGNGNESNLRALVISQQAFFVAGVRLALAAVKDIEATYLDDAAATLAHLEGDPPDVVLVDLDGQTEALLTLARQVRLKTPNVGIVMLSADTSDNQILGAIKAQAAAYLDKNVDAGEMIDTIRRVGRGEYPINEFVTARPRLAAKVLRQFQEFITRQEMSDLVSPLSSRETLILELMARGRLNKQIAYEIGTSEQTIKNHVTSILRKLHVNARTEAVVKALKRGYISLDGIQPPRSGADGSVAGNTPTATGHQVKTYG